MPVSARARPPLGPAALPSPEIPRVRTPGCALGEGSWLPQQR